MLSDMGCMSELVKLERYAELAVALQPIMKLNTPQLRPLMQQVGPLCRVPSSLQLSRPSKNSVDAWCCVLMLQQYQG